MICSAKINYNFLEKIDFKYGFCENSGVILVYEICDDRVKIYNVPDDFLNQISNNQKKLNDHKPINNLIVQKQWLIDEVSISDLRYK